jgi:hypothetical protein
LLAEFLIRDQDATQGVLRKDITILNTSEYDVVRKQHACSVLTKCNRLTFVVSRRAFLTEACDS